MKYLNLVLLVLFTASILQGQAQFCYFDQFVSKQQLTKTQKNEYDSLQYQIDNYLRNATASSATNRSVYTIPIVIHVVSPPKSALGSTFNPSDGEIIKGVELLNQALANTGIFNTSIGNDMKISFCLAKRKPDNQPTDGIDRIESDLVAGNNCANPSTRIDLFEPFKTISSWDCERYLNIWLVSDIFDQQSGCSVAGYAYYPGIGCALDGVVMESNYWSTRLGAEIAAHEVGHYLNLFHTFTGGCKNADCLSDGDKVCDTPPDNSQAYADCKVNSCNTDIPDLTDDHSNFMDYSSCQPKHFTNGQRDRMIAALELFRGPLINSDRCLSAVNNDLAIIRVAYKNCSKKICPTVEITNNGLNDVTTFKILQQVNQGPVQVFDWTGLLKSNQTIKIDLKCISGKIGSNESSITITSVNGMVDNFANNNYYQDVVEVVDFYANFEVLTVSTYERKFSNKSSGATKYFWDFGDGAFSNLKNPNHTYAKYGTYLVKLTIEDTCGGMEMTTQTVLVSACKNGWRGYVLAQNNYQEPDETICDYITNGELRIPPNLSDISFFYTRFSLCDTICVGNEFRYQIKLKNDAISGGISAFDVSIFLNTETQPIGVVMMGEAWGLPYSSIYVGNNIQKNLPQLLQDFSKWNIIDLTIKKDTVYFSSNNSNFYKMKFDGKICNLSGFDLQFKGSGAVDWIKVFDKNNQKVYEENFDDCNRTTSALACSKAPIAVILENESDCELVKYKVTSKSTVASNLQYWITPNLNNHPISDSTFVNLIPGRYQIRVLAECSTLDTIFDLEIPKPLSDSVILISPKNCTFAGKIVLVGTGGILPYQYKIGNGQLQSTGIFENLEPGTYVVTIVDAAGCKKEIPIVIEDNAKTLALKIDSAKTYITCLDNSAYVSVKADGSSKLYYYSIDGLSYQSNGLFKGLKPGKHLIVAVDDYGCSSAPLEINVVLKDTFIDKLITRSLCVNKKIVINGVQYSKAGVFSDTIRNSPNCDTILTIQLLAEGLQSKSISRKLCKGETITINNKSYTFAGIYIDTIQASTGCDTELVIKIENRNFIEAQYDRAICKGDSIQIGKSIYKVAGKYLDTLRNNKSCDSIITTFLKVNEPSNVIIEEYFCEGQKVVINSKAYWTDTTFLARGINQYNCDSITTYKLRRLNTSSHMQNFVLCPGDVVTVGNSIYGKSGKYKDILKNWNGCDSTVFTSIAIGSVELCDSINCRMYIPNAFSPNGDSTNDYFEAAKESVTIQEMSIFDRWGNLLFHEKSSNPRWDGKVNGLDAGIEVYVYMFKGFCKNGLPFVKFGDVTLVR